MEGLATHHGPESCGRAREGVPEALTGVHAGRVLSRESESTSRRRGRPRSRRQHRLHRSGEVQEGLARSYDETPSMRGSTLRENRETLLVPVAVVPRAVVGSLRT